MAEVDENDKENKCTTPVCIFGPFHSYIKNKSPDPP